MEHCCGLYSLRPFMSLQVPSFFFSDLPETTNCVYLIEKYML